VYRRWRAQALTEMDGAATVTGKTSRAKGISPAGLAPDTGAAMRELRRKNWIAAHFRERRCELGLTQEDVAEAAHTSHSYISRLEKGDRLPTLSVLRRILAVLDEDLVIGIVARTSEADDTESEFAPVPDFPTAR
jgi:DNA-binding XRE family transcriptional regulator